MRLYKVIFLLSIIILNNSCRKVEVVPRHEVNLKIISKNRGSVVATDDGDGSTVDLSVVREGTTVRLTASTPYAGYQFSHWEGVDSEDGEVAKITVNGDRTVKAYFTSQEDNPVAAYGQLSVANGKLVDELGVPVQLKGMSFFWSQWIGKYWNSNVVNHLADDWECTIVRASMGVEASGGYLSNPSAELAKVEAVVDAAIAKGMYVIIDWHSHYAYNYTDDAVSFFQYMANKYGDQPNVMYELYNEPIGVGWPTIKAYLQEVTDSIRAIDPDNIILAGTPNYSQGIEVGHDDPLTGTNIMYCLHFYASEMGHNSLKGKLKEALDNNVPIFVSEWGVSEANGNGNFNVDNTNDWLSILDKHDISWCNWSVADKDETSAALTHNAPTNGNWTSTHLTESGTYVRAKCVEYGGFSSPR